LILLHARSEKLKPPLCGGFVPSPAAIVSRRPPPPKNICKPTPKAWAFLFPKAAAAENRAAAPPQDIIKIAPRSARL
jgi:hypothetical protein